MAVTLQKMPVTDKLGNPGPSPFRPDWSQGSVPYDTAGRPMAPVWQTIGDTGTGLVQTPYLSTNQLNSQGLEALRGEALRTPGEMSRWGQMALAQQRDQLAQQGQGQLSQARNQLAMQGGLRSGARERLAQQGMQTQLRAGQSALGGIQRQDEQNRLTLLQQLPQQELAQANYLSGREDTNINRSLNEIFQGRAAQQMQFNEAMRAWGAERTAAATPSSSKK